MTPSLISPAALLFLLPETREDFGPGSLADKSGPAWRRCLLPDHPAMRDVALRAVQGLQLKSRLIGLRTNEGHVALTGRAMRRFSSFHFPKPSEGATDSTVDHKKFVATSRIWI